MEHPSSDKGRGKRRLTKGKKEGEEDVIAKGKLRGRRDREQGEKRVDESGRIRDEQRTRFSASDAPSAPSQILVRPTTQVRVNSTVQTARKPNQFTACSPASGHKKLTSIQPARNPNQHTASFNFFSVRTRTVLDAGFAFKTQIRCSVGSRLFRASAASCFFQFKNVTNHQCTFLKCSRTVRNLRTKPKQSNIECRLETRTTARGQIHWEFESHIKTYGQ